MLSDLLNKPRRLFLIMAIVFSLAAAGTAIYSVNLVIGNVPALVTSQEIAPLTMLNTENVTVEYVPRSALLGKEHLFDMSQIEGKYAQMGLTAGTVIRPEHTLVPPGGSDGLPLRLAVDFTPQHRAISVHIEASRMIGGRLQGGDSVDIIAVIAMQQGEDEIKAARTVAQGVHVLGVITPEEGSQGKISVILAVTLDVAEEIALLSEGGSIHLALAPYSAAHVPTMGITSVEYMQRHFAAGALPPAGNPPSQGR